MNIVEFVNSIDPDEVCRSKTTPNMEQIREAEEELGVKFADDYIECLLNFGKLSVSSTELTGLSEDESELNNVVKMTQMYRELECHDHIPANMYVIQDLDIDLCLIWQDETGAVYVTLPWRGPQKEADSLVEYLNMVYNEDEDEFDEDEMVEDERILKLMSELDNLFYLGLTDESRIINAESELGLRFAGEYRCYVREAGAICGGGIELTGVTNFKRLNVVEVTQREKRINPLIPDDMYVVEVVGVDGMVILQNEIGEIFTAQPKVAPKKFFNSLYDYIESVGRFCPNDNARSSDDFDFEDCDEFDQDLVLRMENGLTPVLPSGKTVHLHHMGLSSGMPIGISPLVEFTDDEYYKPTTLNTLFDGFVCDNNYNRLECIKQKQSHWNARSESY